METGNVSVERLDSTTFVATYTTGAGRFSGEDAHVENGDTLVVTATAGGTHFRNQAVIAKQGSLSITSKKVAGNKITVKFNDPAGATDSSCSIL